MTSAMLTRPAPRELTRLAQGPLRPTAQSPTRPWIDGGVTVSATTVGVFYRRPSPEKPPYVEVGDLVAASDPVCTLEVMKMFTEITAGTSGRVLQILVDDGQPVEFGQPLMVLEPAE